MTYKKERRARMRELRAATGLKLPVAAAIIKKHSRNTLNYASVEEYPSLRRYILLDELSAHQKWRGDTPGMTVVGPRGQYRLDDGSLGFDPW